VTITDAMRVGAETDLRDAARVGAVYEPPKGTVVDAAAIRRLVVGGADVTVDPRGVRVRGVVVSGRLDLRFVESSCPLQLVDCQLPAGADFAFARLKAIDLTDSRLRSPLGQTPLLAEGLVTDGPLVLVKAKVLSVGAPSTVNLMGAHVQGQLDLTEAAITNCSYGPEKTGTALAADGLKVDSDMGMCELIAHGSGERELIRLLGASIGGQLQMAGCRLFARGGRPVVASALTVGDALQLDGVTVSSVGTLHVALKFHSATVKGQLTMTGLNVASQNSCSISLKDATVGSPRLDLKSLATGALRGQKVDLDGLTYDHIPPIKTAKSLGEWLYVLENSTPSYSGQPYQQLAGALKATGDVRFASEVLMASQQARIRSNRPPPTASWQIRASAFSRRLASRCWGFTAGFGYRSYRAFGVVAVLAAVSGVLALTVGDSYGSSALHRTGPGPMTGTSCNASQQAAVGLTLDAPWISEIASGNCDFNTDARPGEWLSWLETIVQLLAGAAAAIAIGGWTGLVRGP
jgi:hypothetical protein